MKEKTLNLLPPTLLLALSALLSRLLGVYRDHLLAHTFGAAAGSGIYDLDVYYAAFRIPDMLYNLLIFGMVSAAFIPIFTRYKKANNFKSAWEFSSAMLHLMFIGMAATAGIACIFAPALVHLVAAGFSGEKFALTVKLMRLMLISPLIFSVSAILISIQDSMKAFFFRSLAPLFYNIGIIAGILFFGKHFGVIGVTWGVIIGAGLQLLIQLPAIPLLCVRHVWILGYKRQDVRRAFALMAPRLLGLSIGQTALVIYTLIASFFATGSIAIFYLADNLQSLPMAVVGVSFAITSFTTLSELAHETEHKPFATELRRVIDRVLFLTIPATVGMILLRHEIIDLILVSGKFSAQDAAMTAQMLMIMLFSLFAQSLAPTLGRAFFAHHDTKTPLWTGLAATFLSLALCLILVIRYHLGIFGIAVAYSAANLLNFLFLLILIQRKIHHLVISARKTCAILASSLVMGLAVWYCKEFLPYSLATGWMMKLTTLSVYAAVGAGVYFGVTGLLIPRHAPLKP